MKISYNWLKDFVEIDLDPQVLADKLSMLGFEVDAVDKRSLDIEGVVIGKVLTKEKHPDADRLSYCSVDIGSGEPLNIVCGAPNVAAGLTVAVATVGTVLPGDFKIRKSKIRGVVSQGMICSESELNISDEADGIWELPDTLSVGSGLGVALGFENDYVLDISITPDRPDAMSHIGIAREVAAAVGKELKIASPKVAEHSDKSSQHASIKIDTSEGCPRYAVRLIRNIKIGSSPEWMQRRLEAAGMRPLNNVVDITNYVMLETGQPLHAFDFDTLAGGKIIVRESKEGETFETLDNKKHTLPENTVMICDAEKSVAIGGVMGGLNSEVSDSTTTVLLESAYFKAENVQSSARKMGIVSEAAQRFSRGTDPNGVVRALERAAELLAEYAGGEVLSELLDVYPTEINKRSIPLDVAQINKLLGTDLSADAMAKLLKPIDIDVQNGNAIIPTFRPDISVTADLAEEVGRLFGYDNIPVRELTALPYRNNFLPEDDFLDYLRDLLVGAGCQETITNSMINVKQWQNLTDEEIYPIMNPISSDMDGMRNSLIPSLLEVVRFNANRQRRDLALFEINNTFHHPGNLKERPEQVLRIGIALSGMRRSSTWHGADEPYDFYDIKGLVELLTDKILLDNSAIIAYANFAVEGQSVKATLGKQEIGYYGKVSAKLSKNFDLDFPVFVAELQVKTLFSNARKDIRYRNIPRYPFVERDFALVVDRSLEAGEIEQVIRQNGGKYLQQITPFDQYIGKQVDDKKKSVAFRLIFQSPDKTLTEEEVSRVTNKILKKLENAFGATLRS